MECLERILFGETQLDHQLRSTTLEAMRTGFGFCGTLETKAEDGHERKLVDESWGTEIKAALWVLIRAARVELPLGLSLFQCLSFFCSGRLGEIREEKPRGPHHEG